ncbi:DUF7555 family protein [Natronomonas marina]|jgi:hypothetical protein|uniref:DUF7555 family protein n=1 Tax=Natronomonas marina TaxID=2961939 RepID=UPI0020C97513|nr:hypothetical protein [Natronomonas marina]
MESIRTRVRTAALVCLDTGSYVAVVAAATTVLAFLFGIVTGGGFVRAKALLFVAGFGLMAYSTARLWPTSPEDTDGGRMQGVTAENGRSIPAPHQQTRFEEMARRLPPARWARLPPADRRLTPAGKLFWSSLAVLVVSYLMESVFGIV